MHEGADGRAENESGRDEGDEECRSGRWVEHLVSPVSPLRTPVKRRFARLFAYGLAGWTVDSLFVFANTGRRRPSGLWNVPVYGLAQPLFEPLHDRLRDRPLRLRAPVYAVGILGVEYVSGRLLRLLLGKAPWDYGDARFAVDGLIRLDYLPLWAAFGLGLEQLHDALTRNRVLSGGVKDAAR